MFLEKAADNRKLCFLQCVAFKGSLIADVMLTLFHLKKYTKLLTFFLYVKKFTTVISCMLWNVLSKRKYLRRYKTCSCPFVWYFRALFWDDITIIWDENIFLTEKKSVLDQLEACYLIVINKLSWYHPKITYEYISYKRTWTSYWFTNHGCALDACSMYDFFYKVQLCVRHFEIIRK